jgi:hypothetical protein
MATMQIIFTLELSGATLQTERIAPEVVQISVGGRHLRNHIALAAGSYTTLYVGEITPAYWYLHNTHATQDLVVSFGVAEDVVLKPGQWAWIPSPRVPMAKGDGGASSLFYAALEA